MATRITVEFDRADYVTLDDTTVLPLALTQYESALAMSALSLLLDREAWNEMTDSQWNDISSRIADLLDEIIGLI